MIVENFEEIFNENISIYRKKYKPSLFETLTPPNDPAKIL